MRTVIQSFLLAVVLWAFNTVLWADELRSFAREEQRQHYEQLISELRCLVCQNQNLADSDIELAQDLRDEVYKMITRDGKTDQEVIEFMVARYGDFVLYRPPVKAATLLLWYGPFALGGLGLFAVLFFLRRRNRQALVATEAVTEQDRLRLKTLLQNSAIDDAARADKHSVGRDRN